MSFINDLIADLKDRNLLPVAIALVLGTLVLPFVVGMGGSDTDAVLATPDANPVDGLPEAQLAAVVTDAGIREYSKRLDSFKQRNPFKQQFVPKGDPTEDAAATDPGVTDVSQPPATTPTSAPTGGGDPTTPSGGGTTPSGDVTTSTSTSTTEFFYNYRATMKFGKKGALKPKKKLPIAALPNDNKPVVLYLGPSNADIEKAVFAVSANEYVSGDGTCLSDSEKTCSYVELSPGDKIEIKSLIDGNVYQLKLKSQEVVEIDDPRSARASKRVVEKKTQRASK